MSLYKIYSPVTPLPPMNNIGTLDYKQLFVIWIPKCACTMLRQLLVELWIYRLFWIDRATLNIKAHHVNRLRRFILKSYVKYKKCLVVVRDPIRRCVSCFLNKHVIIKDKFMKGSIGYYRFLFFLILNELPYTFHSYVKYLYTHLPEPWIDIHDMPQTRQIPLYTDDLRGYYIVDRTENEYVTNENETQYTYSHRPLQKKDLNRICRGIETIYIRMEDPDFIDKVNAFFFKEYKTDTVVVQNIIKNVTNTKHNSTSCSTQSHERADQCTIHELRIMYNHTKKFPPYQDFVSNPEIQQMLSAIYSNDIRFYESVT